MKGFVGAVLLVVGLINVTSGSPVFFGWLSTIIGAIFFVIGLSGPYKGRNWNKKTTAGGVSGGLTGSNHYSGSDSSGGDGGGGGE
ncbi:hypothetical protein [Agaribacter marinus]|uniref:Uncharacterized protein n=1 Tax=Agaribacter marinus TaxID=1431249 RepID=A0AA37T0A7_9ALTE|nr:hypothetical protein [Agaribacter marinus]GLR71231.1 hypothetical protein GCM10007852_21390 [Agaribacter marinus]